MALNLLTIPQIEERLSSLCSRIAPAYAGLSLRTTPGHDGSDHIEIHGGQYHQVVTERGLELSRQSTADVEELLYWLTRDIAWGRAVGYELRHRTRGRSFRRLIFAKWVEYMSRVRPDWAERVQAEIDAILAEHPYDDAVEG